MTSRRSFLTQLGLIGAAGAGGWWLRDHLIWPAPRVSLTSGAPGSGWLPFSQPHQGVVIVGAEVNGIPVQALVDSGAQTSVIDAGLAQRLGLPTALIGPVIVAYGVSGDPQIGRAATLDLRLGTLALEGLRAALFDVAALSAASGRLFSIILGQDVLYALTADFDFPRLRLAFEPPQTYRLPGGAIPAEVRMHGREVRVPVTVEGAALEVTLDTGASLALALSAEAAEAAGVLAGRSVGYAPSVTFGGAAQDRVVRVEAFTFAGRTYSDTPVHIYEPSGSRVPQGLLGVEALQDMRVIVAAADGALHLVRGG